VAGFDRNQWQLSIGISGNLRLELMAGFDRNQWQSSTGIRSCQFRHSDDREISLPLPRLKAFEGDVLIQLI